MLGTINNTSDYTPWTLYYYKFKGISANIELQVCHIEELYGPAVCALGVRSRKLSSDLNSQA
jgi:hypothetical protein